MRWKFLWKMLYFDYGYVTYLNVPIYLVGDACTKIVAILLVFVSILACCNALCIFENHILAFVDLIHASPIRERKVPILCLQGEFLLQGKKNWRNAFVQGEHAFMHLESIFT
jgi:hypothetical protein